MIRLMSAGSGLDDDEEKASPTAIGVYVWVKKIDDVDVVEQSFTANMQIVFGLKGNKEDFDEYNEKGADYKPSIEPLELFSFVNANSISHNFLKFEVIKKGSIDFWGNIVTKVISPYIIMCVYQSTGEFAEEFELRNFPFDCQDLQIKIQATQKSHRMICYPGFFSDTSQTEFEYAILNAQDCNFTQYTCKGLYTEAYLDRGPCAYGGKPFSGVNVRIKLARSWSIYVWKIFLMIFIITLSSFMANSLDDAANKYDLLLTLLLTDVAFQFVISTFIPNLPYLTILDYYAIVSVIVIFCMVVQVYLLEWIDDDWMETFEIGLRHVPYTISISNLIKMTTFVLFCFVQFGFVVMSLVARYREKQKLTMFGIDFANKGYDDEKQTAIMGVRDNACFDGELAAFFEKNVEDKADYNVMNFMHLNKG